MMKLFKTSMVFLLSTCLVLNSIPIYGMDPTGMDDPTIARVMSCYGGNIPVGTDMDVVRTLMTVGVREKASTRATSLIIAKALEFSAPIKQAADTNAARVLQLEAEKINLETNVIPPLRTATARIPVLEGEVLRLTQALDAAQKAKDDLETKVIPQLAEGKTQAELERDEAIQECARLRQELAARDAAEEEAYLRWVDSKWYDGNFLPVNEQREGTSSSLKSEGDRK